MSAVTDKPKRPRKLAVPVSADDHLLGRADAPLTLVEYGDYQCGACARAKPVVDAVRAALGDELRFVFRHFPLRMHPRAELAAEAAEAAAAQGRFWPMHDRLSAHPDALEDEDLRAHARAVGLDLARFDADLREHAHRERVEAQRRGGVRSRMRVTPTFYVNGRRFDGDIETSALMAALRGECF